MPVNLTLVLISIIFFIAGAATEIPYLYIPGCIFYVAQLCEVLCNRTREYLNNTISSDNIEAYLDDLKLKPPIIVFTI